MKQRLKLALAILSDVPLLLLDEPASNLDVRAVEWMRQMLNDHLADRTVLVASNREKAEMDMCLEALDMTLWK
jgi:ABC-type multidrug transport system ATPase subunit